MLPEEQVAQDEELLKEYLGARINQALGTVENGLAVLATDPKNLDKASRLMKAYVALHDLRTELGAQQTRASSAKQEARTALRERGWETPDDAVAAAPTPQATEAFRTAQAAKALQIMQAAGMDTKECPKCHAVMPERAALCFCGYTFAHAGVETPLSAAGAESEQRKNT